MQQRVVGGVIVIKRNWHLSPTSLRPSIPGAGVVDKAKVFFFDVFYILLYFNPSTVQQFPFWTKHL